MFLQRNGEQLYYEVHEGQKQNERFDAVLLLHSLGVDHRLWNYQIEACQQHAPKVVTVDARGHGQSKPYSGVDTEKWTNDIKTLCDELSLHKVVICGISMGGVQALGFALKHPDYVAALILADSFSKIDPAQVETKISMTAGVAKEQGMKRYADSYLDNTLSDSPTAAKIRHELYEAISSISLEAYHQSARACFSVDYEEQLMRIKVPVLVIIGEQDLKTPLEMSEAIQQRIPNALLVTVPNGMHLSNVDNPAVFNKYIVGFLKLI